MTEADIIPIGSRGTPGRGSGGRSTTPSAASRTLAGGNRPRRAAAGTAQQAAAGSQPAGGSTDSPPEVPRPTAGRARASRTTTAGTRTAAARRAPAGRTKPARSTDAAPERDAPDAAGRPEGGGPGSSGRRSPVDDLLELVAELAQQLGDLAPDGLRLPDLPDLGDIGLSDLGFGESSERRLVELIAFARRRLTGDYSVDDFGFDPEFTERVVLPLLRPLYRSWWRVEVKGIENIPDEGGALVVANHSGTVAFDSLMTQVAIHDEHPRHRFLRMLGADFVFRSAVVGEVARKTGSTLACNEDANRLLSQGELVGVWPEGFKGVGKPYSERYKLQRFGRGGFVTAALRTRVPIVPTAIVGAEEIYPIIGNMPTLARLVGAPYVPVTPFFPWLGPLGLIPLPSKWILEFGEPIPTDTLPPSAADDPMAVFNIGDQVREQIQQNLYSLLMQRRSVFF